MIKKIGILLLIPINAFAYNGQFFKIGVGMDDNSGAAKIISTGYQAPIIGFFDYQLEAGAFSDNKQTQGVIGFCGFSAGLSVFSSSGFYLKLFGGPSAITETDTRLSSIFEFNDDFEIGLVDSRGVSLGIDFKHFSNAGMVLPNTGRDFMLLKFQIPL